ncbi:ATP-binding protein, partial [Sphingorhabdus sp.]|uniref:ATP-binding protein n=1 Tax=Sphingorhabdus sp. TaxID=1902408 RepID=UPI0037CBDD8A
MQVAEGDGLLCAVSGGPDSLALLLLAQAVLPGKLVAATVDHQLRPEAADEARYVH